MGTEFPKIKDIKEVAEACRVSVPLVRKWVYEKRLRPIRLGRRIVFDEDEILRFLKENQERG